MLYAALISIPLFAGLLPAIFFRARDVVVVGGIVLSAVMFGVLSSGSTGGFESLMLVILVGVPLVALAFGIGVAVGSQLRVKTEGQPEKRRQAAVVGAIVFIVGVGPIAYAAWQHSR